MPVRPYQGPQLRSVPFPGRYEGPSEKPSLPELVAAAVAQENLISWVLPIEGDELDLWKSTPLYHLFARGNVDLPEFNQYSDENQAGTVFAGNPATWNAIRYANTREAILEADTIVREQVARRELLERGGLAGWFSMIGAGVLSPEVLIPTGAGLKMTSGIGRRMTQLGLANAATAGAVEVLLHQQQPLRPLIESVGSVGGAGLFGSVVGGLSGLYARGVRNRIVADLQRTLDQRGIEELLDEDGRLVIDPQDMAHFEDLHSVAARLGRPVELLKVAEATRKRRLGGALQIRNAIRGFWSNVETRVSGAEKKAEADATRPAAQDLVMSAEEVTEAIEEHGSLSYAPREDDLEMELREAGDLPTEGRTAPEPEAPGAAPRAAEPPEPGPPMGGLPPAPTSQVMRAMEGLEAQKAGLGPLDQALKGQPGATRIVLAALDQNLDTLPKLVGWLRQNLGKRLPGLDFSDDFRLRNAVQQLTGERLYRELDDDVGTGGLLSIGLRILQGVRAVRAAAKRGEGVDTLRPGPFGNPFPPSGKAVHGAARVRAVEDYEAWLRGTAHQDFQQELRAEVLRRIDAGELDDKELLYYTNEAPNHAEVLKRVAEERRAAPEGTPLDAIPEGIPPARSPAIVELAVPVPKELRPGLATLAEGFWHGAGRESGAVRAAGEQGTIDTSLMPVDSLSSVKGLGKKTVAALRELGLETIHDIRQAFLDDTLQPGTVPRGTFLKLRTAVWMPDELAFLDSELIDPGLESPARIQALSILKRRNPSALQGAVRATTQTRSGMGISPAGEAVLNDALDAEATRAMGRVDQRSVEYERALAEHEKAELEEAAAKGGSGEKAAELRAARTAEALRGAESRLSVAGEESRQLETEKAERPKRGAWRGVQRAYHLKQQGMDPRHAQWLLRQGDIAAEEGEAASAAAAKAFEAETAELPKRTSAPAPRRAKIETKVPLDHPTPAPFFQKPDGARGMRVFLLESKPVRRSGTVELEHVGKVQVDQSGTPPAEGIDVHPGFLPMRQNLYGAAVVIGNNPGTGMVEIAMEAPFTSPEMNVLTRRMMRGQRFLQRAQSAGDQKAAAKAEERMEELRELRSKEAERLRRGGQARVVLVHQSQLAAGLDANGRPIKASGFEDRARATARAGLQSTDPAERAARKKRLEAEIEKLEMLAASFGREARRRYAERVTTLRSELLALGSRQGSTVEPTTGIRRGTPTSELDPEATAKASFGTFAGRQTADLVSGFADTMGSTADQMGERVSDLRGVIKRNEAAIRTILKKQRAGAMAPDKADWAVRQRMGELAEAEDELAALFTESNPLRYRTMDDPFLDRLTDSFSQGSRPRSSPYVPEARKTPETIPPKTVLFLDHLNEKLKSIRGMVLTGAPKEQVDTAVNNVISVARRNQPFLDPETGIPDPIHEAVLLEDLADAILGNPLDADIPPEIWELVSRGEMPQALQRWKTLRKAEMQAAGNTPEVIVEEMERLNALIEDASRWYTTEGRKLAAGERQEIDRARAARDIDEIAVADEDSPTGGRGIRETGDTRTAQERAPLDEDLDDYEARQLAAERQEVETDELDEPVEMPDDVQLLDDERGPGAWMSPRLRAQQLQQLGVQRVHQKLAKVFGTDVDNLKRWLRWSPKLRLVTSPNPYLSKFAQELTSIGLFMNKNQWGIPNLPSVEDKVRDRQGTMLQLLEEIPRAYARYYKRVNGLPVSGQEGPYEGVKLGVKQRVRAVSRMAERAISPAQFRIRVGEAMIEGDRHPIPEVQAMAQLIRGRVYAPALDELKTLGMLPDGLDPAIAPSYMTRIYKIDRIKKDRQLFLSIAQQHYESKQVRPAEAKKLAQETLDHILGSPDGIIPWEAIEFKRTRAGEKRAFDIADADLNRFGFLDLDIDTQIKFYFRSVIPDIELGKLHSKLTPNKTPLYRADPGMKSVLSRLRKQYQTMINNEPDPKMQAELEKRKDSDLRDAESLIHELRGTLGAPRDPDSFWVRAGAAIRRNNVMLDAGTFTLSSLPDVARPVMLYGVRRVYGTMIRDMLKSWPTFKLNAREMKAFGTAGDIWTNVRAQSMGDVGDLYGRHTPFENALRIGSEYMSFLSLLAPWNTMLKQWVGGGVQQMMAEDLLGTVLRGTARGTKLPQQEMVRRWARLGFGPQDLARVTRQLEARVAAGAVDPNGVIEVASHLWTDREMALRWRVAVRRQVDQAIMTPGIGDKPIFMSGEAGRFFTQYKTFSVTATTHMMLLSGQQADRAVWNGIMLGTAVGMGSIYLKSKIYGYDVPDANSPAGMAWWIRNGIDRTGIWGMLGNFNDFLGIATRGGFTAGRPFGGPDPGYRYTSRNVLTELVGPSSGTALDYGEVLGGIGDLLQGRAPSRASSNAFKRTIWMNNTVFLSRSLDRMVGGGRRVVVNALDLDPPRSARERKRPRRARPPEALLVESQPEEASQ